MTIRMKWMAVASLMALASCSDDTAGTYTVGKDDNALALTLGVDNAPDANGTRSVSKRAASRAGEDESSADTYTNLTTGTGIRLRVEGAWTSGGSTKDIVELSHAVTGAPTTGATYNPVKSYTPTLYWDDFGAADPDNKTNTEKGVNIYAVAVDGLTTAPDIAKDTQWGDATGETNLLTWSTTDNSTDLLLNRDLVVANNLSDQTESTGPGRLTFAEHKAINRNETGADPLQARLVFKHVLSKITFNLKAANGFTDYKFKATPTVTLTRSKTSETTKTYYCYTNGTVNIKKGVATKSGDAAEVTLKKTAESTEGTYQVIKEEAVVYPGSTIMTKEDNIVAMINADDNVYYITGKVIKDAIDKEFPTEEDATKYQTKAGYNYVFNVTVNKTGVTVTATVIDWNNLSGEAEPKIDVTAEVGDKGSAATISGFSFYRMADESTGTDRKYNLSFKTGDYYAEEAYATIASDGTCTFSKDGMATSLYWPDHQTHYHFRGIYPQTGSSASDTGKPLVTDITVDNTSVQAIKVSNSKYDTTSFPSNLMIGKPEIASKTMCGNADHTNGKGEVDMSEHGICAREGKVNFNFRYMMSQVQVNLQTTTGDDKVNISGTTKVEIENAQTEGWVGLDSRSIEQFGSATSTYQLNNTTTDANCLVRHDCIVPQALKDLTFKISILNADGTVAEFYRATIADIKVKEVDSDGNVTGDAKSITAWEAGKKYIYTLTLKKTKVTVTATITDWTTKTAESDIWL